jgi:YidC/Oxa1 family membrane protein insertase
MNRNTVFNFVVFLALSAIVLGGWWYIENTFFPKPPAPTPAGNKPERETVLAITGGLPATDKELIPWRSSFFPKLVDIPKPVLAPTPAAPSEPHRLIKLGGDDFNTKVMLTSKGAGVQNVQLQAFEHATREGKIYRDDSGTPYPLELIPGYRTTRDPNSVRTKPERLVLSPTPIGSSVEAVVARELTEPSYTLLHYTNDEAYPSQELAKRNWKVVKETPDEVAFETILEAPYSITIRKTFTLKKTDYHVGMKLSFTGIEGQRQAEVRGRTALRYQVIGARGLPIEGEWYTGTFRNALVGWKTPYGYGKRDIQMSKQIVVEHGGAKIEPQGNTFTYAAVVTQFFSSALCIDPDADESERKNWWAYVRPTREDNADIPSDKPQLGDITVRAVSNPIDPTPGQTITHSYWLYNGPTKVRLLKQLDLLEDGKNIYQTDASLVDRYVYDLTLFTFTDAPTPNWFGRLADSLFWTSLVVWFTNLMHDVLGFLHRIVGVWGLNIIMLTVLVRLLLLFPSRRQQASMMKLQDKMAALKPEIDKITLKYKDNPQLLQQEKTRLMLSSGVNPLSSMGGCLLMFAQMPIFMGLYFCLQESIFFRLDNFLWIKNLAAPDMLLWWTEAVPWATAATDMGGMIYVGPYLNVLPIIAVTLMFINMKVSSPPPTDEQQEMQQKMMKYMMVFMGFMFYKMAAGMCVYFTISTSWGLIERYLLKKKQKRLAEEKANQPAGAVVEPALPSAPAKPTGLLGRFKENLMQRMEEIQKQAEAQRQIVNNPQGQQKTGGSQQQRPKDQRKNRKKRK